MEFTSSNDQGRVRNTLEQIHTAINQLKEWNADITSGNLTIKNDLHALQEAIEYFIQTA